MTVKELLEVINNGQKYTLISHWLGVEYQIDEDTIKSKVKGIETDGNALIIYIDF